MTTKEIQQCKDSKARLIKARLDKLTFCGYKNDADFMRVSHQDFLDYAKGELVLAIGRGDFNDAITVLIGQAMARGAYSHEQFKLEQSAGLTS